MNKFMKDGLIIGLIGSVCFAGYVGYKVNKINEMVDNFTLEVDSFNKTVPKPLIANHKLTKGTFQSNGEYVLRLEENNEFAELKLKYHVDHGIKAIFSGKYPIVGSIEVYDNQGIVEALKIDKNIMDVKGAFLNNGNIDLKGTSKPINLKDTVGLTVDVATLDYNYNAKTKYLSGSLNIPKAQHELGVNLKDVKFLMESSKENMLLGKGKVSIGEVNSPYGKVKNITSEYFSAKKNDKYDIGLNLNVEEAQTSMTSKNKINLGLNIGINDIDGMFLDQYYKMTQDLSTGKTESNENLDFERLFKKGFSFNINNILYSDGENVIKGRGLIKVNEQGESEPLDVRKNTQVRFLWEGKGEMVEMVKSIYPPEYGYFEGQSEKEASLDILFNNNKLIINKKEAQQEELDDVNQFFDEITNKINEMK